MSEKDFVHLHLHTDFSLLDGAIQIKPLAARAQEIGARAVAVTDHGNMYGILPFYKACKANGITPVIGSELYQALLAVRQRIRGLVLAVLEVDESLHANREHWAVREIIGKAVPPQKAGSMWNSQPRGSTQVSTVQASPSSQSTGVFAGHAPLEQVPSTSEVSVSPYPS